MGMNTGDISRRFGFPVNTEALVAAGITVGEQVGRATMFSDEWPVVCQKFSDYVLTLQGNAAVAKPPAAPKPEKAPASTTKSPTPPAPPATSSPFRSDDDF